MAPGNEPPKFTKAESDEFYRQSTSKFARKQYDADKNNEDFEDIILQAEAERRAFEEGRTYGYEPEIEYLGINTKVKCRGCHYLIAVHDEGAEPRCFLCCMQNKMGTGQPLTDDEARRKVEEQRRRKEEQEREDAMAPPPRWAGMDLQGQQPRRGQRKPDWKQPSKPKLEDPPAGEEGGESARGRGGGKEGQEEGKEDAREAVEWGEEELERHDRNDLLPHQDRVVHLQLSTAARKLKEKEEQEQRSRKRMRDRPAAEHERNQKRVRTISSFPMPDNDDLPPLPVFRRPERDDDSSDDRPIVRRRAPSVDSLPPWPDAPPSPPPPPGPFPLPPTDMLCVAEVANSSRCRNRALDYSAGQFCERHEEDFENGKGPYRVLEAQMRDKVQAQRAVAAVMAEYARDGRPAPSDRDAELVVQERELERLAGLSVEADERLAEMDEEDAPGSEKRRQRKCMAGLSEARLALEKKLNEFKEIYRREYEKAMESSRPAAAEGDPASNGHVANEPGANNGFIPIEDIVPPPKPIVKSTGLALKEKARDAARAAHEAANRRLGDLTLYDEEEDEGEVARQRAVVETLRQRFLMLQREVDDRTKREEQGTGSQRPAAPQPIAKSAELLMKERESTEAARRCGVAQGKLFTLTLSGENPNPLAVAAQRGEVARLRKRWQKLQKQVQKMRKAEAEGSRNQQPAAPREPQRKKDTPQRLPAENGSVEDDERDVVHRSGASSMELAAKRRLLNRARKAHETAFDRRQEMTTESSSGEVPEAVQAEIDVLYQRVVTLENELKDIEKVAERDEE